MARNRAIGATIGLKTSIFGRPMGNRLKRPLKARNRSASKVLFNDLCRSRRKPGQCIDKPQASQTETQASVVGTPDPNPVLCTDGQLQPALLSVAETWTFLDPASCLVTPLATPASVELTNSATLPSPKLVFTINRTAWPEWLTEKNNHCTTLKFGDKWRECLFLWTEIL